MFSGVTGYGVYDCLPTKSRVSRESVAMTFRPEAGKTCGLWLTWLGQGHLAWSSLEFPWNYMVKLPTFLTLQLLSCDCGAESTDFLSSILSARLTRVSLP